MGKLTCSEHGSWTVEELREIYELPIEATDENFGCPVCGTILWPTEEE